MGRKGDYGGCRLTDDEGKKVNARQERGKKQRMKKVRD